MGEASGKVRRVLTLFLVCCLVQLAAAGRAAALDSLYGALTSRSEKANPFRGISIPPRDELWAASPIRRGRVPPSRRRHLSSHDCGGLLSQLALGFRALRPDAPHPKRDDIVAWTVHVEMETFRDLFWCALKGDLAETLEEIDQLDAKPVPMPYRVSPITHNFSEFSQWARPFQRIRGIIGDGDTSPIAVAANDRSWDEAHLVRRSIRFEPFCRDWPLCGEEVCSAGSSGSELSP